MSKRSNPDFMNGVPELLVLSFLERRPMHGYELVRALKQISDETLAFGEGCIYPILHRLEAEKLLVARSESVGGRERLVYRVTAAGRKRLTERANVWRRVTEAVAFALKGENDGIVRLA